MHDAAVKTGKVDIRKVEEILGISKGEVSSGVSPTSSYPLTGSCSIFRNYAVYSKYLRKNILYLKMKIASLVDINVQALNIIDYKSKF